MYATLIKMLFLSGELAWAHHSLSGSVYILSQLLFCVLEMQRWRRFGFCPAWGKWSGKKWYHIGQVLRMCVG